MLEFESGYTVETVFDGSKHGIEPHAIQVSPDGELLILDSANSNILTVTPPLSRCMCVTCSLKLGFSNFTSETFIV